MQPRRAFRKDRKQSPSHWSDEYNEYWGNSYMKRCICSSARATISGSIGHEKSRCVIWTHLTGIIWATADCGGPHLTLHFLFSHSRFELKISKSNDNQNWSKESSCRCTLSTAEKMDIRAFCRSVYCYERTYFGRGDQSGYVSRDSYWVPSQWH